MLVHYNNSMVNCTHVQTRCLDNQQSLALTTLQSLTPISQPEVLSHSQLELENRKVFPPSPVLFLEAQSGPIIWIPTCSRNTDLQHCILYPLKQQIFYGFSCDPGAGGQHGTNHQQESPKWRNEIHFPWRGGLLEWKENKPHPPPLHAHTRTLEAFAKPQEQK